MTHSATMWLRALVTAVACTLVLGGCGRDGRAPICGAEAGARVCLIPKSTGHVYGIDATGFKADTELEVTAAPEVPALRLRLGPEGTYADGRDGASGLVLPSGAAPVTVTVMGTAGSGQPVVLSLTTKS